MAFDKSDYPKKFELFFGWVTLFSFLSSNFFDADFFRCRFFSPLIFFAADFFNPLRLSPMANLFLNIDPIPKSPSPFSDRVMGNFFQDICY